MPVTRTQANSLSAAKPTSSNTNTSNKETTNQDETSAEAEQQRRESPDNCSICLGPFNNKSFTSSCAHSFCFICLKQWSKVKAECPLCKQPFTSIFHNIRSDQSYDIYELPILQPSRHNGFEFYFPSSLNTFSAHSHPYLSLAQPGLDADLTLSNFSRFQFRHRRYDRYLQHPVQGEHQYSFLFNPATHVSAVSWPRGAEDFRRAVYKHRLGPPLFILGNETSNYHLTPAMVNASAHRLQRIMPWLTRELKVLLKSHQSVRLTISVIQPLLSQVLIDSPHFSEKVSPLIGRKARQFIQEFIAFANSALTIQAFDRKAIYFRQDTSTLLLDNSSSRSSTDDDIVEITDVSSDPEIIAPTSPVAGSSGLLRVGWNTPTPGPSWESLNVFSTLPNREIETVSVSSESDDPVFRPDLIDSDSSSKAGSDIVFLKYDKPWTERSPIRLSSDSDNERKFKKRSKHKKKRRDHSAAGDHKSGRLKSSEVSKHKTASDEDTSLFQETSVALKNRVHSSSSEKQKRKKKKKNRDRELVDRLFAQALSNKLNLPRNIDLDDGPSSSKTTENIGKSSHMEKFKHKHKKKDRKRSRDSQSSSNMRSYKKHHSGHKKSGDKNPQPESGRKKHRSKHKPQGDNIPSTSNESESLCWDTQLLRTQPLQSQSIVGHSSFAQPNYLTVPDTLQHIPLNLWVSAWPAIPTSHAFSGAPPSSTFLSSSVPLSSNPALNANDLSSESSSETDSDDTEDYSIPSVTTCTRTKQWLDDNFPHSKKGTINSSKGNAPTNASIWQTVNSHCTQTQNPLGTFKSVVNVVSESDDEDVVVCSSSGTSSSSSKSDNEVQVTKDLTQNDCLSTNITSVTSCPPCSSANQKREDTKNDSDSEQTSTTIISASSIEHEFLKPLIKNENVIVNELRKPLALTQENTYFDENIEGNQISNNCLTSNYVSAHSEQSDDLVISNCITPLTQSGFTCSSQGVLDTTSINLSASLFNASILSSWSSKPLQPPCVPLNLTLNSVPPLKNAIFSHLFQPHSQPISQVASISNSTTSKTSSPKATQSKNVISFAVEEILSNSDILYTDSKSRNESVNSMEETNIAAARIDQQRAYNLGVSSDSIALDLQIPNGEETNNSKDQQKTYNLDAKSDSLALNLQIPNGEEANYIKDQTNTKW